MKPKSWIALALLLIVVTIDANPLTNFEEQEGQYSNDAFISLGVNQNSARSHNYDLADGIIRTESRMLNGASQYVMECIGRVNNTKFPRRPKNLQCTLKMLWSVTERPTQHIYVTVLVPLPSPTKIGRVTIPFSSFGSDVIRSVKHNLKNSKGFPFKTRTCRFGVSALGAGGETKYIVKGNYRQDWVC